MKRSTILIFIGAFIIVTALLGMNKGNKMYQKEKHFNTVNEVIEELTLNPVKIVDNEGRYRTSDAALECMSQRKRLTETDLNYGRIELEEIMNLDEDTKNSILYTYNQFRESFTKAKPISKEEVVKLKVREYNYHLENGEMVADNEEKPNEFYMNVVLIDEGEGLVIDYISQYNEEHMTEDGKNA